MIVVVLLGLGLGKLAAVLLGNGGAFSQPKGAPSFTPLPTNASTPTSSPSPKPSPSPSGSPSESPSPSPSSSASASLSPSASPSPKATPTASAKPSVVPSVIYITPQPKATPEKTLKPAPTPTETPAPTPAATPAVITGEVSPAHAASIVRSYVAALASGQESFAAGYLSRGLPNESFISAGSRIASIQSTQTGNGTFLVTAVIETAGGTYNESFTLQAGPNGLQITDHNPTKI